MIPARRYKPKQPLKFLKATNSHKYKKEYLEEAIFLDTETSWNHDPDNPIGWLYQWAFAFGEEVVTGRKPSELIKCLRKIVREYWTEGYQRIIVYVHNLSYDISYLWHYITNEWGQWKVLAIAPHRFITFECGPFIFKCSYMLANRSLAKWGKDLFIEQKKKEDLIDYNLIRYQDTPLTKEDDLYMEYDVLALQECFRKQLQIYKHNITNVPLTATGYVRMDVRKASKSDISERDKFLGRRLSLSLYNMSVFAFAGGFTHGNRHLVSTTVRGSILHRDFASHYPTQQMCQLMPVGPWFRVPDPKMEDIEIWKSRGYCLLIEFAFEDCELKDKHYPMPYMQASKAQQGKRTKIYTIEDNGRIMKLTGMVSLVATEIDWEIYQKQYSFKRIKILSMYRSAAGYLPKWFSESVGKYFEGKTKFKELAKAETDEDKKADYLISLMKSKNSLNGIYGLSASRLVRPELELDSEGEWHETNTKTDKEKLDEYYKSRNSFMSYQWGVWTTAHARNQLLQAVDIIIDKSDYDNFLYADTDSCFYVSTPEIERAFDKWNDDLRAIAERRGAYTEYNGKKVYMNQFDLEDEKITAFRFLHAKCYAYITDDKKLHATIAGVPAKSKEHGITREEELGCIDNLKDGFTFSKCGGSRIIYTERKPSKITLDGHRLEVSSSACITKTTKTLGELPMLGLDYDTALEGKAEEGRI